MACFLRPSTRRVGDHPAEWDAIEERYGVRSARRPASAATVKLIGAKDVERAPAMTHRSRWILIALLGVGGCLAGGVTVARWLAPPPYSSVFQMELSPSGRLVAMSVERVFPPIIGGGHSDMALVIRRVREGDVRGEFAPRVDDLVVFRFGEHNIACIYWLSEAELAVAVISGKKIDRTLVYERLTVRVSSI